MIEIRDITDENILQAWLETQPPKVAAIIAGRAALRVLPIYGAAMGKADARKSGLTALPVLRCHLSSGVARKTPTPEDKALTAAAAAAAALTALTADAARAALTAARAAFTAALTADALAAAADAARAAFTAALADRISTKVFWREIRFDAELLARNGDPETARLWSSTPPKSFETADTAMRAVWQRDSRNWAFWTRWWNGVLAGEPLDWDLQFAVATEISEEIWKKGPAPVAEAIAALQDRMARAKTQVAERVEINPETGRLRLVPESALPEDVGTYVRRKMSRALALFPDREANQYTGLSPVFAVLDSALEDAGDMPIELFDACASASRLTAALGARGDCPTAEQDPRIADFLHRIREAGADILAHDPATRDMLEKRHAITGNNALVEAGGEVVEAATKIADQAEGRLATTLPDDAATATNPDADPEARKDASFRLAGRLLRVAKIAYEGMEKLLTLEGAFALVMRVIAAILRWLFS